MALKWNRHNGNYLISASRDHFCKLFDIRNLKEEVQCFRGHKKEACSKLIFFVFLCLQIKIDYPWVIHHQHLLRACICLRVCLFLNEIKFSLSPTHVNKNGYDHRISIEMFMCGFVCSLLFFYPNKSFVDQILSNENYQ